MPPPKTPQQGKDRHIGLPLQFMLKSSQHNLPQYFPNHATIGAHTFVVRAIL